MHSKPLNSDASFAIKKIYVRASSFEVPHGSEIFRSEWKPEVKVEMENHIEQQADDLYDIALDFTVTVTTNNTVACIAKVIQAGIFEIKSFEPELQHYLQGSYCATLLFPYVNEAISRMMLCGGFQPILLEPINFDAVYRQAMEQLGKQST
jgi:preprotein translocase subunit SecB